MSIYLLDLKPFSASWSNVFVHYYCHFETR